MSRFFVFLFALLTHTAAAPVQDWNAAFTTTFRSANPTPALAARNLAIFHKAIQYAIARAGEDSSENHVHAAARTIAVALYPSDAARFNKLLPENFQAPPNAVAAARQVLRSRENDGSTTTRVYVPTDAPGHWVRTTRNRPAETPHWPGVRPFSIPSADAFRPPAPPAPGTPEFEKALKEVRALGAKNSSTRTAEQTEIAKFWSDFDATTTPPGHWNAIARQVSKKLSLTESAHLFYRLNTALADAALAAFDAKYHHDYWRPETAIGNHWQSLLPSPSHPEYPSAHSTFSAAAAEILTNAFGENTPFEITSDALPGVTREFHNFHAAAQEVGRSRIYGGIHFSFSDRAGQAIGRKVAEELLLEN